MEKKKTPTKTKEKVKVSFKPKAVTKKILSPLQARAYDVIVARFGLTDDAERKTLESIGEKYGITRERVRQIEHAALSSIRKSPEYKEHNAIFEELKGIVHKLGAVVAEDELLESLGEDTASKNHFHFYFVLGDEFRKEKEDDHFKARWIVNDEVAEMVHDALRKLYSSLDDNELIPEREIINRFLDNLKNVNSALYDEEVAKRWLGISKRIGRNPLGEYGKVESPSVRTRGVKDYAYLVMRKHGGPMHFREVAKAICDTFGRETHTATCHNELIKDSRFVLVGRGIYVLKEWGYEPGVVKEVIKNILKKNGPMTKDDIVNAVLKERFLKRNTILVNLQNPKYFKKQKSGLYTIA